MQLSDFYYNLPPELIARYPLAKRSASRLLQVGSELIHGHFSDIVDWVSPNDLLVFNNSKVIPARLLGRKATGGRVEILVERILEHNQILAHLRASKSPAVGGRLYFDQGHEFIVVGRQQNLFILQYDSTSSVLETIEKIGEIPLPPYMQRSAEAFDKERYQTIYAENKGSVAAPTAGLHFDAPLMAVLRAKQVNMAFLTLHVGAGTFLPVRTHNILEHHMHPEYIAVSSATCDQVRQTRSRGGRVIAVGTTSARSLEAASQSGEIQPYQGDTTLFIYPGYSFKSVDILLTNFHLPESTLLMLVCALGGYDRIMQAYREAVAKQYRFYSYGDAMWVPKASSALAIT